MPLIDANDPAMWDGGPTSLYRDGFGRGYSVKENWTGGGHMELAQGLGLKPGERIVLVGAAFGWVAEDWIESGLWPVLALDTSEYIHAHKDTEAHIPILKHDPGDPEVLDAMDGLQAHWCISEDVLPILSDAEAVALSQRMRTCGMKVVHWISCGVRKHDDPNVWMGDPRLNWKTLEEWSELLAPDIVVARNENNRVL